MRLALPANPRSGGGLDPEPLVEAMREHGAQVEVFGSEDLDGAAAMQPDRIVVAGGDGSIAPAAWAAGRLDVPLAVVPAGTANDFARTNGLPEDPLDAAVLAAAGQTLRRLELGHLADGHPFVNAANAGLASEAARYAAPFKRVLGPLAYAVGALRAAVSESPLRCTVRVDGREVFSGGAWQVIVAVTGAFGGGSELGAADPARRGARRRGAARRLPDRARTPGLGAAARDDRRAAPGRAPPRPRRRGPAARGDRAQRRRRAARERPGDA